MKRRKWTSKEKALVVLEWLKGKSVAEICSEHQISQSQYYQWRNQFYSKVSKVFEVHEQTQKDQRLERDNEKVKRLVGELTLELKKARRCWDEASALAGGVRVKRGHRGADQGSEVRASLLGLSAKLGASAVRWRACGEPETHPAADAEA